MSKNRKHGPTANHKKSFKRVRRELKYLYANFAYDLMLATQVIDKFDDPTPETAKGAY